MIRSTPKLLSSIESTYVLGDICDPCSIQAVDCFIRFIIINHSTISLTIPFGDQVFFLVLISLAI